MSRVKVRKRGKSNITKALFICTNAQMTTCTLNLTHLGLMHGKSRCQDILGSWEAILCIMPLCSICHGLPIAKTTSDGEVIGDFVMIEGTTAQIKIACI